MRKYQQIWEALKNKKAAKVEAPKSSHKKIVRGVIKEKCYDDAFKVLCAEFGNLYKLHYTTDGEEILFLLLPEKSSKNL